MKPEELEPLWVRALDASEREILDREIRDGRLVHRKNSALVGVVPPQGEEEVTPMVLGEDTRDLRDPTELGDALLRIRQEAPQKALSKAADYAAKAGLI